MADGEIRIEITGDARNLTRAVQSVKSDLGALEKRAGGLGDALKTAFASAAGFLAAGAIQAGLSAITQGIGSAVGKAAELQSELNFLQAVTGATGEQMAKVSQLAKELGADVSIPAASALDAAKAMTELAKAGLSVEQAMAAAKGTLQLAAAGQLEAARAAEIIAGALNAFKLTGDQAVRVADLLAAAANASAADVTDMADALKMASAVAAMTGVSIEETIAMLSMMANAGIQGSDAGTSLKVMLMRLIAPTKDAAEAMQLYNISIYDSQGRMLPLRDIIAQFSEKLAEGAAAAMTFSLTNKKMAKEAAKAAASVGPLSDRLESQQRRLSALQLELAKAIEKYGEGSAQVIRKRNAIADLEAAISRTASRLAEANEKVETFAALEGKTASHVFKVTEELRNQALVNIFGSDAIRAANIILAAGIDSYDQMYQAVTRANAAQDLAAARTRGLTGAQEALSNAVETLSISFGEGLLPALAEAGFALADALTKPEVIAFVERLGALIGGALTEGLTLLRDVASTIDLGALFSSFQIGTSELQTALESLGAQIFIIGQSVGMHLQAAFQELAPVVQDVGSAAKEFLSALIPIIADVLEALRPIVTVIGNALISAIRTFVSVLKHALETLAQVMRAIAALLRGDIDGFVNHARGAFESLTAGIRAGFGGAIQTVAALFGDVGQQVLGTISRINDALMNIRNLGASVAQGISQALGNIRLPQLPFGGGQQQSNQTNITNNYNLNVQAASSQGVMNDFELMRRLGWR